MLNQLYILVGIIPAMLPMHTYNCIIPTQSKPARGATNSTSEFDEMLEMLEPDDVNDLAGTYVRNVSLAFC